MWSDIKVSREISRYYKDKPKDRIWMTRMEAYRNGQQNVPWNTEVDFWFQEGYYKLIGNMTAFWGVQLMKMFFPDKPVLLFGFDMSFPKGKEKIKIYDEWTDLDSKSRNHKKYITETMPKFVLWIDQWAKQKPELAKTVYNCNLESNLKTFTKVNYREIIK